MATAPTQRSYRAPCPGCGAPVEFKSAQSVYAVCPYCQSTVVRRGDVLRRIGKMAELFDDHSPLQLMSSGRITLDGKEQAFTLIGRLQYKSDAGVWAEWTAFLPDGELATLSEDNGAYVFTRAATLQQALPDLSTLRPGATVTLDGTPYSVAFSGQAQLIAAEGELPKLPPLGELFDLLELRSSDGAVLSIDASRHPPAVDRGRAVLLDDLQLKGLKDDSSKEESARQFSCPHCGAPVQVHLPGSKSVTCPSCKSLISLESGVGEEMAFATQNQTVRPVIALGSKGNLQGVPWQVVGFQQRKGQEEGDDETFSWSEYLLYNQKRGFSFLVDSTDGWSLVAPTTGAPQMLNGGRTAKYLGAGYQLQSAYEAETTYVLGEFYWKVERGQRTTNLDFSSSKGLLSFEKTDTEVTWSSGDRLDSKTVAEAFGLDNLATRDDPGPFVAAKGGGCGTVITIIVILIWVLIVMTDCSGSSSGNRTSGGSYGGYSSGGSHK